MINVSATWRTNYFNSRLNSEAWSNASEEDQNNAITMAGFIVDGAFKWRKGAYVIVDGVKIWDDQINAAVCEQAIWVIQHNITDYPDVLTKGIEEAEGGEDISVKFSKEFIIPHLSPLVAVMIGELGELVTYETGTIDFLNLIRG